MVVYKFRISEKYPNNLVIVAELAEWLSETKEIPKSTVKRLNNMKTLLHSTMETQFL